CGAGPPPRQGPPPVGPGPSAESGDGLFSSCPAGAWRFRLLPPLQASAVRIRHSTLVIQADFAAAAKLQTPGLRCLRWLSGGCCAGMGASGAHSNAVGCLAPKCGVGSSSEIWWVVIGVVGIGRIAKCLSRVSDCLTG